VPGDSALAVPTVVPTTTAAPRRLLDLFRWAARHLAAAARSTSRGQPVRGNAHVTAYRLKYRRTCYDNAMAETFFVTLKSKLVWRTISDSRREAVEAIPYAHVS
jgi:hypothetical protein